MKYIHTTDERNKVHFGSISFSEKEIRDIIKSWLAISLAFALIISGVGSGLFAAFVLSALTVGVGFIAHELGHKVLAQKYGAWAEFRAWDQMLLFAIVLALLFGVVFAAPGAVMIMGRTIGKSRYGKIAAAGPIMSYVVALVFLGISLVFADGLFALIGQYGFMINTWLGLFNMIPFAMLDGKKIWDWDKRVFWLLVGVGGVLMGVQGIV